MKKVLRALQRGQAIVEILIAMGLLAIVAPALLAGFYNASGGKVQQNQRIEAVALMKEAEEAVRNVRERGWSSFEASGTFHPAVVNDQWLLQADQESINGFTRGLVISNVYRDANGAIVTGGGMFDGSTKKVVITVSWDLPYVSVVNSTLYVTRFVQNTVQMQTSQQEFASGSATSVLVTNTSGGELTLMPNTKGKWCSPALSSATISLPDGPPVSVAATASASVDKPNDVLIATAPTAATSFKLAHAIVTANTDTPTPSLRGNFTLDATKYSAAGLVPTGIGLDNSFITNVVKYYKAPSGKVYALIATTKPDREVIAILVDDGNLNNDNTNNGEYQDYVNKIYKYSTFFNTRIYEGNTASTPNQDQSPYGHGGSSLAVFENRGYLTSGGYLYVFDLNNIDSKTPSSGLDMMGCRIELEGYDCNVSTSRIRKYNAGGTGTTFQSEQNWLSGCVDGGNVEIYATNDVYPVRVGSSTYVYIAFGGATSPEFGIANVTNIPTSGTFPSISSSSCGRILTENNSSWKRISSIDFNSQTSTQEAANSVFATADGTRAYVSSNGGIDANNNGVPDSHQFYIINTSNKSSPAFLSGNPSTGATSGYYYGTGANAQLYPRQSFTVLNGQRALLVGKDGVSDSTNAVEYQVLNIATEATPAYCGGIDFSQGFNDLSSVAEADGDKFVYMVANSTVNELKIIQGGPDGTYLESGTYESSTIDHGAEVAFNRIGTTTTVPLNTTLTFQVAVADAVSGSCNGVTFTYVGPDGTASTFFGSTGGTIPLSDNGSGYENPGRCARYKAYLSTTDYNVTPSILDVHLNYSL